MQNLVITSKGQELMSKLIAGTTTATFTKIAGSDHDYSDVSLEGITELEDVKQTALISKVSRTDLTIVEVLAALDNSSLTEGYYVRALGLYAKDGDGTEVLYAISIEPYTPDYLPAFSGKTISSITYRLITKVDNSEQVTLEVNPAAYPTMEQVDNIQRMIELHTATKVFGETGVHGMRYFNDILQVQNAEGEWVDIETGGGGIAPNNVSDLKIKVGNQKLTITWSDPEDTIVDGQTLCTWKGTKLVQKAGTFPENAKDGTLLLDNQTRDKYKTNGFEITGLTNGETYYFALFPYADTGATNLNTANRISGTPQPYRTMTAVIDLTNSNPLSAVTYADDAAGMTKGSEDWDDFLGYYPVLLDASGNELGKLNPNNYAQYEDGTAAPINTLGSYDVMVAFPKRGLKISTENNKVTISMTDDPDNADFKYYAHSYGAHNNCDVVYVGAYKASANGTKLYSCSGQSPLVSQTIGTFRTYANNRGEGYEQMTFYVRTFLCCAYILRFGNLNSQAAVGQGYVNASARTNTGATNAQGMNYGTTSQTTQIKCLGIEDLWGNVYEWVDGIFSSSTRNILTAIYNKNMNDTGSGYQDNGQGASSNIGNYMSRPQGTTETGFVAKEVSGSASTYFCDYAHLYASRLAYAGGSYGYADDAGVFQLSVSISASGSTADIGGRLIKFKTAE